MVMLEALNALYGDCLLLRYPDLFEAVLAPTIADPLRERAIARRAGDMGIGRQERVRVACPGCRGERQEAIFEAALRGGGRRGEAVECVD